MGVRASWWPCVAPRAGRPLTAGPAPLCAVAGQAEPLEGSDGGAVTWPWYRTDADRACSKNSSRGRHSRTGDQTTCYKSTGLRRAWRRASALSASSVKCSGRAFGRCSRTTKPGEILQVIGAKATRNGEGKVTPVLQD